MALETPSSRLQWQLSEQGSWERDIDECERFYICSTRKGKGCFPVTGYASFLVTPPNSTTTVQEERLVEVALRKAWITLRHKHPTLGSRIQRDKDSNRFRRVYWPFQGSDEEKSWVCSTFKVVDTGINALGWFNDNALAFESPTLFLVRSKDGDNRDHTIFLQCPHDMCDGVGILQLVNQLFHYAALAREQGDQYSLPELAKEYEGLSPCLQIAAAIPDSLSETHTNRFKVIQRQNAAIYEHNSLIGLPQSSTGTDDMENEKILRLSIPVSKTITAQVLHSCKEIVPGVTVTHVFISALALALADLQSRKEEPYPVRYVNHSMLNLRPYCRHPYNSPDHAAAAYHTISAQALGIDLDVPGSSDKATKDQSIDELRRIVTQVRDFFKELRADSPTGIDEQVALAPATFKAFTPPPSSDPHAVSEPLFCPVSLSSMGNVNSIVQPMHGPFELTNVWAASEPIGAGVALFLGSWGGEMELSSVFDARYHEPDYIEGFLGRILDRVREGLGIDKYAAIDRAGPTKVQRARIESEKASNVT
ncbi:hypothetical protein BDV30DRAFT_247369 [Aspergillus minisclerotigenes]|uniref:Alcohol acetyltransferase n=1 Tax=Aspergillus minisclerotigenes TaxID=656917 RepID=A0A5N6IK56_9EURO|nr:hypothetical protein BDV30DRAFT_247369 [Aspergillus minisclerotigenes]